ncbi:UNVERIFIED_ORG: RES family NAD+ phosphorylase [Shinella sp. XGS7]|nr:RES family NAD+ phosphorylase [Shinella sp. XGS7]
MQAESAENNTWQSAWFDSVRSIAEPMWRGVEEKYTVEKVRLTDTAEECAALEAMLEESKPPLPAGTDGLHYLLSTPFRYFSPTPTRFRSSGEKGIWYGASSLRTACAELAYWRMRFVKDSAGLAKDKDGLRTTHVFYEAMVSGRAVDLMSAPWITQREVWVHPSDYTGTQALAAAARQHDCEWIRYESVRDPGSHCAAVLEPAVFTGVQPLQSVNCVCKASRDRVLFFPAGGDPMSWDY